MCFLGVSVVIAGHRGSANVRKDTSLRTELLPLVNPPGLGAGLYNVPSADNTKTLLDRRAANNAFSMFPPRELKNQGATCVPVCLYRLSQQNNVLPIPEGWNIAQWSCALREFPHNNSQILATLAGYEHCRGASAGIVS